LFLLPSGALAADFSSHFFSRLTSRCIDEDDAFQKPGFQSVFVSGMLDFFSFSLNSAAVLLRVFLSANLILFEENQ